MTTTISTYEQSALDFLAKTGCDFKCEFLRNDKHFADDTETRDIYKITLKRGSRKYSFEFGQSLNKSGFYANYGKRKIALPIEKMTDDVNKLRFYIRMNLMNDYGSVKTDSIHYPEAPTSYDVLACLQKSPVYDFADFCSEFGYEEDSRKAYKIYKAVKREWENVNILFTDEEIEQLQEIN